MTHIRPTLLAGAAAALALAAPAVAAAQANPTFSYGKAEEVKEVKAVDWSAIAEAGLVLTSGNSKTTTATAGAKVIRLDADNKFEGTVNLAYARSTIVIAADRNNDGVLSEGEEDEQSSTTANAWQTKLRYDRFLTASNSLYAAALFGADQPAGKELVGGGQLGYSRLLFSCPEKYTVTSEIGYDFSYEDLAIGDPLSIHSVRVFAGYKATPNDKVSIDASVEALGNLNSLKTVPEESGPFEDLRVNTGAAVTAKLTSKVSLSFSIAAKLDNRPAPRPALGIPYEEGYIPTAEKLDTITKASLIIALF